MKFINSENFDENFDDLLLSKNGEDLLKGRFDLEPIAVGEYEGEYQNIAKKVFSLLGNNSSEAWISPSRGTLTKPILYSIANENKAYQFIWKSSLRDKVEYGAFLTDKGVLVLPSTNNEIRATDFSALPTRKVDGRWQVKYNDQWLNILAAIHTHPANEWPYGSDFEPARSGKGPSFIITSTDVWVAYRQSDGFEDAARVMTNKQLLYEKWSLYDNLSKVPR